MSGEQTIQWFPGHMAKTKRRIKEILPLIDAVAEVVDARIPVSSRNPDLAEIIGDKPRIIILNKCDMADPKVTADWIAFYKKKGITAIGVDCKTGKGLNKFKDTVKTALAYKLEQYAEKGMVDELNAANIMDCMECGACAFACPARMHLTHMFKTGKQLVKDKAAAEKAAAEAAKKAEEEKKEAESK